MKISTEKRLECVYGIGGGFTAHLDEPFQNFSNEVQQNYLWACSELAEEIKKLTCIFFRQQQK